MATEAPAPAPPQRPSRQLRCARRLEAIDHGARAAGVALVGLQGAALRSEP
jgi:hypothetical protein